MVRDIMRMALGAVVVSSLLACGPGLPQPVVSDPPTVLTGNETREFRLFPKASLPIDLTGTYTAEVNRVPLSIVIADGIGPVVDVTRFAGPTGATQVVKVYATRREGDRLVSDDGAFRFVPTEAGPLVFEADSGTAAVPGNAWVAYGRIK